MLPGVEIVSSIDMCGVYHTIHSVPAQGSQRMQFFNMTGVNLMLVNVGRKRSAFCGGK